LISKVRAILWNYDPDADQQPAGHTDEAWAASFSSDGLLLATGSDDTDETRRIKIWEAATGRLIRGWSAHDTTTAALAFHPRLRLLASAGLSSANNLRLWDADTGALTATLHGHTDKVRSVAFSPDGTLLASAGSDGTVRIWDVASRSALRRLDGHSGTVRAVVFNRRGDRLASCGTDGTVRIWEASTGNEVRREVRRSGVAAVAFAPDDRTLAWAAEDGVVEFQDLEQGRPLPPLHIEDGELRALA
jgi:WD40 repeat protein